MDSIAERLKSRPHVIKFELYIDYCEDEKVPYEPNYTNTSFSCPGRYTLQYIPQGCGTITINGQTHSAKAGDFMVIFPGDHIIEKADANDPWYFIWAYFLGESVLPFLTAAGFSNERRFLHGCQNTRIPTIMKSISEAAHNINNPLRLPLLSSKCFELFHEICRVSTSRGIMHIQQSTRDDYVDRATSYLNLNYKDSTLSIDSLAHAIGLTRSYLYRIFKETIGISPQEYLMHIRIDKACELLLISENTVTSVAHSVGYEPLSFTRAFKNTTGITPTEYRKTYKRV